VNPFWSRVIAPMLKAIRPRVIVEIGAAFGGNTRNLLGFAGENGAELHVVDPVPQFDPAELEAETGGRMTLHEKKSLEALADIGPADVTLIDGDHNWYTVHSELELIEETSRGNDPELPLLFFHDVSWPYARRDSYYVPEDIPEEFRQDWARKPIFPGSPELEDSRGVNPGMANALVEGGPRNGVLTAIEDFVEASRHVLRLRTVPGYAGLGILVPDSTLAQSEELRRQWEKLEGAPFLRDHVNRMEASLNRSKALHATATRDLAVAARRLEAAEAKLAAEGAADGVG
jgi:hypothetical protein